MAVEPTPNKPINQQSKEFNNDEIDLFELWERFCQQKLLILSIVGLFTSAGVIYSFVATPVYKASAYLLPPLSKDILVLQINLTNVPFFDKSFNDTTDREGIKDIKIL